MKSLYDQCSRRMGICIYTAIQRACDCYCRHTDWVLPRYKPSCWGSLNVIHHSVLDIAARSRSRRSGRRPINARYECKLGYVIFLAIGQGPAGHIEKQDIRRQIRGIVHDLFDVSTQALDIVRNDLSWSTSIVSLRQRSKLQIQVLWSLPLEFNS